MTLFCLCQDQRLRELVQVEAKRLRWTAEFGVFLEADVHAEFKTPAEILLFEMPGPAELSKWKEMKVASQKFAVAFTDETSETFLCDALDAGIDIFLPLEALTARRFAASLNALIRRRVAIDRHELFVFRLNLLLLSDDCSAKINGQCVGLTLTEFRIVRELASESEAPVSRHDIQARVFGKPDLEARSLDVHVCSIRKKFKPCGLDVYCVRGVGYKVVQLQAEPDQG